MIEASSSTAPSSPETRGAQASPHGWWWQTASRVTVVASTLLGAAAVVLLSQLAIDRPDRVAELVFALSLPVLMTIVGAGWCVSRSRNAVGGLLAAVAATAVFVYARLLMETW